MYDRLSMLFKHYRKRNFLISSIPNSSNAFLDCHIIYSSTTLFSDSILVDWISTAVSLYLMGIWYVLYEYTSWTMCKSENLEQLSRRFLNFFLSELFHFTKIHFARWSSRVSSGIFKMRLTLALSRRVTHYYVVENLYQLLKWL